MNAHDRIWKTLSHEEPDRIPTFCQTIDPPFVKKYRKYMTKNGNGLKYYRNWFLLFKRELAVAKSLGLDAKWKHSGLFFPHFFHKPKIPTKLKQKYLQKGRVNLAGHIYGWNRGEQWYIDGILKTPDLVREWITYVKNFQPGPDFYWRYTGKLWRKGCEMGVVPIPTAGGPTYTTWASIGLNRLAYMIRKYPNLVRELHSAWTDVDIRMQTRLFEQGIDMVFICDDHAYKDRCMFSKSQFQDLFVDNLKRMANNAHKHGAKLLMHTDGNLEQEIPQLIEAGFDAVEPLEYEANNRLKPLKELYGDKITLIGNVASSDVLSFGTVEQTIAMTKQMILDAGEKGGYILAPGSDIIPNTKIENIEAMIATVHKYGTYPLASHFS